MELWFTCRQCGTTALAPEMGFVDGVSLALGVKRFRCPACGSVLSEPPDNVPSSGGSSRFVVFPDGLRIFLRTSGGPGRGGRSAMVLSGQESGRASVSLLEAANYYVQCLEPSPASLEQVRRELPEIVIVAADSPSATEISRVILSDALLASQYKALPPDAEPVGFGGAA